MSKLKHKLIDVYALLWALAGVVFCLVAVVMSFMDGAYWATVLYAFVLPVQTWVVCWLAKKVFWPKEEPTHE